ncbi:ATP-dependent nuclease subunit B [Helicobacter sp. 11S02596-1]|uniref:tetratricopeptide repeat protein n=1 Tax=Helicobacter sp. 11S02596-1 TaxID=1476194 RepID=UPI000BDC3826|nr:ATP-dependent nuclease subunit B [Helicobacter sp. 11S02596-1]PAF44679.1 ATP-dependent nuclease subunit B [Helicobacter sp. 11S02596-1]
MHKNILKVALSVMICMPAMSVFLQAETFPEDYYLMIASDAFNRGDFETAKDDYLVLYEETNQIAYARQAAVCAASMGDFETALKLAILYQETTKDTNDLPTNKIIADGYIRMGDIKKAISLLETIKKKEDSLSVDNVLGTLYLSQKEFGKAFLLLDRFYNETHDEEALEKIITIYLAKNNKTAALNLLKSHLRKYGCSSQLCEKSFNTFAQFNDLTDAQEVFKEIYEKSPTIENARYYIWILASQKKYKQAQEIAQTFPLDRHLLLDLYVVQKDFAGASKQASLIYQEQKDPKYLALEAVYLYEAMQTPQKDTIKKVVQKLENALNQRKKEISSIKENLNHQDAFFYNFLGYMLIDYDMNIKKGIDYVKVALGIDPSSISYVDSLAWGYYKLGKCKEAQKIFSTIPKDQIEIEPELKAHFEAINTCAQ